MSILYKMALTTIQHRALQWSAKQFIATPLIPFIGKEQAIAKDSFQGTTSFLPSEKQRYLLSLPSNNVLEDLVELDLLSRSYHGYHKQWGYTLTPLGKNVARDNPKTEQTLTKLLHTITLTSQEDELWRALLRQEEILIEVYTMRTQDFTPFIFPSEVAEKMYEEMSVSHPSDSELNGLYQLGLLGRIDTPAQDEGRNITVYRYFVSWSGVEYLQRWALVDEDTVESREYLARTFIAEQSKLAKRLYRDYFRSLAEKLDEELDDDDDDSGQGFGDMEIF